MLILYGPLGCADHSLTIIKSFLWIKGQEIISDLIHMNFDFSQLHLPTIFWQEALITGMIPRLKLYLCMPDILNDHASF